MARTGAEAKKSAAKIDKMFLTYPKAEDFPERIPAVSRLSCSAANRSSSHCLQEPLKGVKIVCQGRSSFPGQVISRFWTATNEGFLGPDVFCFFELLEL
jgi:hypothetical protein